MLEIAYSPSFVKKFKKIKKKNQALAEEILEKIELFKDVDNHEQLKVHANKGRLRGNHSFSVNYKDRILFKYINKKSEVYLIAFGDHNIYK